MCIGKRRSYFSKGSWENKTNFWFHSARWQLMTQKFQILVTCYHRILTLMCENKVQWWGTTGGHWASANRQNVVNERNIFTSTTIKYELLLLSLLLLLPWFLHYRLHITWWSSVLIFFCKHHSLMAESFSYLF